MTKLKRLLPLVMCVLLIAALIPVQTYAIDPIDTDRDVALTVNFCFNTTPLPGAEFKLYRVADCSESAEFTVTKDFAASGVDLSDPSIKSWETALKILSYYVSSHSEILPLDTAVTGTDGTASFPCKQTSLKPGLYLVAGSETVIGNKSYSSLPFLICLPSQDSLTGEWQYDVIASPKPGANEDVTPSPVPSPIPSPKPSPSPSPKPSPSPYPSPSPSPKPGLPQTGVLWWPVPVMLIAGFFLIFVGIVKHRCANEK